MNTVKRTSAASFRALALHAHAILRGVPLRDVTVVDLPGGGTGRTLADVRALMAAEVAQHSGRATRVLFAFRAWIGRLLGWDAQRAHDVNSPYRARVPADVVERSSVRIGQRQGPFVTLYELAEESLSSRRATASFTLFWRPHSSRRVKDTASTGRYTSFPFRALRKFTWLSSNRFDATSCTHPFSGRCARGGYCAILARSRRTSDDEKGSP